MARYDWVTLTTDYGLSDGFVAMLHGVLAVDAPHARVIDVTHLVPPQDVTRAARLLAQVVPHLPTAVHVAVVDPGVGTARRAIALEAPDGLLVGPDNGLLLPAAAALGGVLSAVALTNEEWYRQPVSATFHGRDIFAPVAARLASGSLLSGAGTALDPASLVRLPEPLVRLGSGFVEAEVCTVDQYGNVQLAVNGDAISGWPTAIHLGGAPATLGRTFADAPPGEPVIFVDSAGLVAIAVNGASAAHLLRLSPGDVVRLSIEGTPHA
jgi:S-adenosylmethionine hydrolase